MTYTSNKIALEENGYSLLAALYTEKEVEQIVDTLERSKMEGSAYLKTNDLFAIRQLLSTIPELTAQLFNQNLTALLSQLFESDCFLTKAIYFDKPSESNWFVAYHQDLSISVKEKVEVAGYKNWTYKKGQYGVQPPISVLEDTITIRIHLDHTDANNGALKILPTSHLKGIHRIEAVDMAQAAEISCEVEKGGVMLMKPLTFHASGRTTNKKQRRVLHLEFCSQELATPLEWLERLDIKQVCNKV